MSAMLVKCSFETKGSARNFSFVNSLDFSDSDKHETDTIKQLIDVREGVTFIDGFSQDDINLILYSLCVN